MIGFTLEAKPKISRQAFQKMSLSERMDDDRHFVIVINNGVFFDDPYFPIREFVTYAIQWLEKVDEDFVYHTIDDDQNPLVAFKRTGRSYKLYSVWQRFDCQEPFSLETIQAFICNIITQVIQ